MHLDFANHFVHNTIKIYMVNKVQHLAQKYNVELIPAN